MRYEVLGPWLGRAVVLLLALGASAAVGALPVPPADAAAALQAAPPGAQQGAQPGAQQAAPADQAEAPLPGAQDAVKPGIDEIKDLIEDDADAPTAVFAYQNRDLLTLRSTVFGRTPQERAGNATRVLDQLVAEHTIGPVTTRAVNGGVLLYVNGRGVIGLTDSDLGATGESASVASAEVARRLEQALTEALELRSPVQLLHEILRAALATLLLAVVLRGLWMLHGRLLAVLARQAVPDAAAPRGARPLDMTRYGVHHLRMLLYRFARVLVVVTGLVALWIWFTWTLLQFPYLRPLGESLNANLKEPLLRVLNGALDAIPDLIVATVILLVTRLVVRGSNAFFDSVRLGRVSVPWVDAEIAMPTRRIVSFVLWVFGVVLAFPYLPGSGTEAFRGMTVFLGVVLSLGSTGVVSQAVSGIMLMYARILRVGDYVRIGEDEGTVTHVSLLATRLRTVWSEELVLPNSIVLTRTTTNFSRFRGEGGVRVHADVTIGYDAPWRQVHAMLLRAAARTTGIRRHPEPLVLQLELADYYVKYRLSVALEVPGERFRVLSALHQNIQDDFNEHGVQIMSPHFMANPPKPVVVPPDRWYATPAEPPAQAPG